jgi:steroid delta-isomerase-like uncharacterized protein
MFIKDAVFRDPSAGAIQKKAAIIEYAKIMFLAFPDIKYDVTAQHDTGEGKIITEYTMTGTNKGPLPGMMPSSKSMKVDAVDIMEVEDGKIKALRGFFDRLAIAEQLGWVQQ